MYLYLVIKLRLALYMLHIQNKISFSLIRIIHIPRNNCLTCTIRQKYDTYSNLYNYDYFLAGVHRKIQVNFDKHDEYKHEL